MYRKSIKQSPRISNVFIKLNPKVNCSALPYLFISSVSSSSYPLFKPKTEPKFLYERSSLSGGGVFFFLLFEMGNGIGKVGIYCSGGWTKHNRAVVISDPLDEGLGHSFCYVRPDPCRNSIAKVHSEETTTTVWSISGASVSANTSTLLSTSDLFSYSSFDKAAAFESSTSFASIPLQPVPRCWVNSDNLSGNFGGMMGSGPFERGFLSGPIERGLSSGPLEKFVDNKMLQRSFSHGGLDFGGKLKKGCLIQGIGRAIVKKISRGQNSIAPIKGIVSVKEGNWVNGVERNCENSTYLSSELSLDDEDSMGSQNLQWAQGKAGEDIVHVVISEEHGWVFVGIYDGFNGPDAPDFLLSNLYLAIEKELKGLLWDDKCDDSITRVIPNSNSKKNNVSFQIDEFDSTRKREQRSVGLELENYPCSSGNLNLDSNFRAGRVKNLNSKFKGAGKKWAESHRRWRCEWDRERLELDKKMKEQLNRSDSVKHSDVLKALSQALKKTEEAYLNITDLMAMENPELALMGSCVMVMLMKGDDVYVMNVGDSRAVLAQKAEPHFWLGKAPQDLERINEETLHDLDTSDGDADEDEKLPSSIALQLTKDHSTSVAEEVHRIKHAHPDDAYAVTNDRVKGSLKVTRAFGAGFLKQPKFNNALLEMFRIDYVGTSPYLSCLPSLYHHRLSPRDRFLILSSDGLYQYFTNEEAVSEIELFISSHPEGDPAQHLVEEVLFRAAKRAGMDFHALLEIPQGDRRKYHDDVSIIVISLEGRIWRSSI